MMILRSIVLALALGASPALANDVSPWFGSEASGATKINVSVDSESALTTQTKNAWGATDTCPPDGCPVVSTAVKYHK